MSAELAGFYLVFSSSSPFHFLPWHYSCLTVLQVRVCLYNSATLLCRCTCPSSCLYFVLCLWCVGTCVYTCFCILWYCWWLYLLSLLHSMFCSGLSVCLFSVALFCLYCACMFLLFANQSGSCAFLRCLRFLRNSFPSSVCIWHDLTSTLPCTIAFVQRPECGCLNLTVCPDDNASRGTAPLL